MCALWGRLGHTHNAFNCKTHVNSANSEDFDVGRHVDQESRVSQGCTKPKHTTSYFSSAWIMQDAGCCSQNEWITNASGMMHKEKGQGAMHLYTLICICIMSIAICMYACVFANGSPLPKLWPMVLEAGPSARPPAMPVVRKHTTTHAKPRVYIHIHVYMYRYVYTEKCIIYGNRVKMITACI